MESAASPGCPRIRTCPAAATRPFSAWLLLASAKLTPDVLSVSDRDLEKEEHEVQGDNRCPLLR